MKRTILAINLLLIIFIFGCAITNKRMAAWTGHHYGELMQAWGPPSAIMEDGHGGKIIIYSKQKVWQSAPGHATIYRTPTGHSVQYTNPQYMGYTAYRAFWADSNGIIYRWQWKGL